MPLLSQPLVELCLRMPAYLLIRSGRDRAIARRAFASELPETTIKRTAKGRVDQYVRNIVDANLDFLREFLLDGLLVREGLLNRDNLELYLTKERSPADFQYSEILHEHLCVEAWLRRSLELATPTARPCRRSPALANPQADDPAVRVRVLLVVAEARQRVVQERRVTVEEVRARSAPGACDPGPPAPLPSW